MKVISIEVLINFCIKEYVKVISIEVLIKFCAQKQIHNNQSVGDLSK